MLKTTGLLNKLAANKNNGSKSVSNKNGNNKLAFRKNVNDDKVDRFDISRNSIKYVKKSANLFKLRKSKNKKMSKSWNLAKSGKKLSKNENLTNFNTIAARLKFLIFNARITFNYLQLAFIKAPILEHFDLKCHIWIETDASSYAISRVLSQLTSRTNPNKVATKTNLNQWHLVAFFWRKIILTKTWYKIPNGKLLAII